MTRLVRPWRLLGASDLAAATTQFRAAFEDWCGHWFTSDRPALGPAVAVSPGGLVPLASGESRWVVRGEVAIGFPDGVRLALAALNAPSTTLESPGTETAILEQLELTIREDLLSRVASVLGAAGEPSIEWDESASRIRLSQGGTSFPIALRDRPMCRIIIGLPVFERLRATRPPVAALPSVPLKDLIAELPVEASARLASISLRVADLAALAVGDVISLDARMDCVASLHLNSSGTVLGVGHLHKRAGRRCIRLIDRSPSDHLTVET